MRSSPKGPKRKRSSAAPTSVDDAVVVTSDAAATDGVAAASPALMVALASNCVVKDAAAFKVSLCAVADSDEPVVLDAGNVERIDTATIQLLCAFVRERVDRNRTVVWQGASAALIEAARLLGVQALLALPAGGENSR
jgi:ABC-type transporter Mla MlaB component